MKKGNIPDSPVKPKEIKKRENGLDLLYQSSNSGDETNEDDYEGEKSKLNQNSKKVTGEDDDSQKQNYLKANSNTKIDQRSLHRLKVWSHKKSQQTESLSAKEEIKKRNSSSKNEPKSIEGD